MESHGPTARRDARTRWPSTRCSASCSASPICGGREVLSRVRPRRARGRRSPRPVRVRASAPLGVDLPARRAASASNTSRLARTPTTSMRSSQRLATLGVPTTAPHPLADDEGVWITDPKASPSRSSAPTKSRPTAAAMPPAERLRTAKARPRRVPRPAPTRPRHLSHILMFTSDVMRSVAFYRERARPAPVRSLGRDHRLHAWRARQRPPHARVREVRRAGAASLVLGRSDDRRGRRRHGADGRSGLHATDGAWAAT